MRQTSCSTYRRRHADLLFVRRFMIFRMHIIIVHKCILILSPITAIICVYCFEPDAIGTYLYTHDASNTLEGNFEIIVGERDHRDRGTRPHIVDIYICSPLPNEPINVASRCGAKTVWGAPTRGNRPIINIIAWHIICYLCMV